MKSILLDTGVIVSLLDRSERHHSQCVDVLSDLAGALVEKLLTKYRDVPMDLADACLVDLADRLETGRILTLDRDFEIYRWRSRRRFDLLVSL